MPQALAFILVGFQVGFTTGIGAIFTALGPLLQIGVSIGLSLASSLLNRPKAPKPEDVQGNLRQSISPRVRLYGRGLLGGAWAFGGTYAGSFHKVVATHSGKLSGINAFWVDDNIVTPDPVTGIVSGPPYNGFLRIEHRLGLPTETHYSNLSAEFPEWTESHRGDGVASLYIKQFALKQEYITKVFPNLFNTLYRMDANGVAVFDPTDDSQSIDDASTWTWSDDLARSVMDFLWHRDGMRMPKSMIATPLALEGWRQAVEDCNDLMQLKAGGTESRYRLWCPYRLDERPADVLFRMLSAGNARLKPTPDGGLTIEVGKWRSPTVTIDDDCIVAFDNVGRGRDVMQTANVINAVYTSAGHQFQSTDADPWIDENDVSERGEFATDVNAICSPSHRQTRTLQKWAAYRSNPDWVGSFVLNKRGLKAFGERFINLEYSDLGLSGTFEITDFKFLFGEHSTIIGATIAVQSMPAEVGDWVVEEEGTEPPFSDIEEDGTSYPDVEDFTAELVIKNVGGVNLPYARLAWTAPTNAALTVEIRAKKVVDTVWTTVPYSEDEATTDWLLAEEGADYEFEARHKGVATEGAWVDSTPSTLVAATDTVAPVALVNFDAVGGYTHAGMAPLTFTTAVDDHLARIALYQVPTGDPLDRDVHFAFRLNGVPKPAIFGYDYPAAAGTWDYYAIPENVSGMEGPESGPVTITTT